MKYPLRLALVNGQACIIDADFRPVAAPPDEADDMQWLETTGEEIVARANLGEAQLRVEARKQDIWPGAYYDQW